MIKILFVCHGNICRSPMAEFVMKDLVKKKGLEDEFYIASAATSREEIGNGVHPGTRKKLGEFGISTAGKTAIQITKTDYAKYDFILGMESYNLRNIGRIIGRDEAHKVYRLLDFTNNPRDIDDPWYTGDFDKTYEDICEGCQALIAYLLKNK
ncbi:low molecular weight protein-tyrosine-phosphatase [Cellulosilyticum ruminicola]|uniref:low molecular weight protein-tyrosine-phosphatase n=1 Tax=Cellulosilyticum ruminicola TaxID=425254 RepID=UPI0006D17232|nr:low molecular weight protein-tyrosine-phosphatase [Cellulosilyticum ruminicola]